jgi:hypothetical protein
MQIDCIQSSASFSTGASKSAQVFNDLRYFIYVESLILIDMFQSLQTADIQPVDDHFSSVTSPGSLEPHGLKSVFCRNEFTQNEGKPLFSAVKDGRIDNLAHSISLIFLEGGIRHRDVSKTQPRFTIVPIDHPK